MALLVEPVEIKNQLYDFLSNHSTLSEIATWSKSMLDFIPEEADDEEKDFPVAAVTWTFQFNAQETAPFYVGGGDRRVLTLWVCISSKGEAEGTDDEATDESVRLGNLVGLALRSLDGRFLNYGGNQAAENVSVAELRIRAVRKSLKDNMAYWYSTVYCKVEVTNTRMMIS